MFSEEADEVRLLVARDVRPSVSEVQRLKLGPGGVKDGPYRKRQRLRPTKQGAKVAAGVAIAYFRAPRDVGPSKGPADRPIVQMCGEVLVVRQVAEDGQVQLGRKMNERGFRARLG